MMKSEKIAASLQLMRLEKPIGWLLLLWPTLWGLWIASNGKPSLKHVFIFVCGVFLMRSAGCIINDLADKDLDGAVKRTSHRPLVTGRISIKAALTLAMIVSLLAFILVLQLNYFAIMLSVVGLLLTSVYPFLKRYTHLPQLWLGVAFAWGIPMAFAATLNTIPWQGWYLFFTTIVWVVAYDAIYAMVDREDDLKIGVKSIAILFGENDVVIIALLQGTVLTLLAAFGLFLHLGWAYFVALVVAAVLASYQIFLIKGRASEPCFKAFLNNNWFGMVVFVGILVSI